jgi:putative flippase GtrA
MPIQQFSRFLVVGVGNTLVSFVVYRLLLGARIPYVIAAAVAFGAGAVNGYVFNRSWTFRARDSMRARATYVAIQIGGAGLTTALVAFFVQIAGLGRLAAFAVAIPIVTVSTFMANRTWAFADREGPRLALDERQQRSPEGQGEA